MKKPWETPELVILYRGRPEESVLTHCKHANSAPVGPDHRYGSCHHGSQNNCTACSGSAIS